MFELLLEASEACIQSDEKTKIEETYHSLQKRNAIWSEPLVCCSPLDGSGEADMMKVVAEIS